MARYGQRPENALKRANEFIEVGKPARALDTLQEVFRNKKWAYNWSESVLEPIMFKYLDLCVELKKSHIAKEGLFQYRNMFQSVNVGSLENVIRGYLRMAEEKAENAREQSAQAVVDIDDLDNVATPESILLSAVSVEDAQDRSDRTILTPWVKFLWESYCQCLELLRTNAHVENLYHDIARMAFQFCLKYSRKTEFRKLCDKLRKHLEDICKLPTQVSNVSMSKPETQQLNLETRLNQLDYGIQMELWQEAYKAIEDIHNLMNISKKMPVPKTMANYYQKLAMVFWKAGNYLFHAAALFKLFQLSKEMKKNITQEELQKMACHVLLATLAIPLPSSHPEFDRFIETDKSPLEKAQKLTVLLSLVQPPSRASILKDLERANVISLATPQLQELYKCLEVDFSPLTLCTRVYEFIKSLENEDNCVLKQYIPALQDVTLVRLVKQIAQVYQCIELARLIQIAKFTTSFHLERLLVDCVRHNDMQIRIDHRKQCICFGMDLSESQREDKPEGPTLQVMPSELVRNQLIDMATVLKQAVYVINPDKKKVEREKLRAVMVQNYHENKIKEHQKILQRHKIIEDRKEYIERLNTVREVEEQKRLEEIQRQQALAEQKRLEQEREERERKRALSEIQQIKDRHLKEKLQQFSQTEHGQKLLKKLDEDDLKKLDVDQIAAKEAEELQKERRELQAKLKSQEKKVDYFERAKRIEEIPLFQKALDEKQIQDRNFWEQQENERIQGIIEERNLAVATRDRLYSMTMDKNEFLTKLKAQRRHVFEEKLEEFRTVMSVERKKRLIERKTVRREERRSAYLKNKQEEAERKAVEEKRRQNEEKERLEEMARKEKEDLETIEKEEQEKKRREHLEMLERVAALKRAKEEEIEQKLLEERDSSRGKLKEDTFWRKVTDKEAVKKDSTTSSWRNSEKSDGEDTNKTEVWRPRFRGSIEEKPKTDCWRTVGEDRKEDRRAFDRDLERFSLKGSKYPPREYKDERDRRGESECREERDDKDRRFDRDRRNERDHKHERGRRDYRDDRDRREGRDSRDPRDRREERDRHKDRREDRDYGGERQRRVDQDRHVDGRLSWRNVIKSEDELYNRESVFQGVSEGSWRAKGADRKDEPIRRDDRGVSSSQREKPSLDEPPRESEDGWSQVSRRR